MWSSKVAKIIRPLVWSNFVAVHHTLYLYWLIDMLHCVLKWSSFSKWSPLFEKDLTGPSWCHLDIESYTAHFTLVFESNRHNRPFTWSGHVVQNHTCCNANCTVGLPKQNNPYQLTGSPTVQLASLQHVWFCAIWPDQIAQRALCLRGKVVSGLIPGLFNNYSTSTHWIWDDR